MYRRVLVPVDGSDCAERAAEYGLGVARAYDAAVDLLSVVETGESVPFIGGDERQRHGGRSREALDGVTALADDAGLRVETHVLEGSPARNIVDSAVETDVDVVVMGTHDYRGRATYLPRSTTAAVLRRTDTPVLAVPDGDLTGTVRDEFEDVLLPTDGSEDAGRAIDHARSIATRFGARLHVLTAVNVREAAGPFKAGGVDQEWIDRLLEKSENLVQDVADGIREEAPDLELETAVVRGTPPEVIEEYVRDTGLDLVAMGSRDRSGLERRLFGSVTERIVGAGVAPVLVVD